MPWPGTAAGSAAAGDDKAVGSAGRGGPTGAIEVTVAASGRPARTRTLRVTLDHGAAFEKFPDRLAAGLDALAAAASGLPPVAGTVTVDASDRLVDILFPSPSAVDPRTHFATWLGVTVDVGSPGMVAGLKVYANLTAPGGRGPAELAARWEEFTEPVAITVDDDLAEPQFAAVSVDAEAHTAIRIYSRPRPACGHQLLARAAARCGLDPNRVLAEVNGNGFGHAAWSGDLVTMIEAGPTNEAPRFSVHLSARAAPSPATAWQCARETLARMTGGGTADEELFTLAVGQPERWRVSGLALGFADGGKTQRVNVYLAPG